MKGNGVQLLAEIEFQMIFSEDSFLVIEKFRGVAQIMGPKKSKFGVGNLILALQKAQGPISTA